MKKSNFSVFCTAGIFAAVFFLAFLVMRNIPLFGDDYYYTTFWGENFWKLHKEHYMLANGRAIVHFLATVFIAAAPVLWQILNSALLALIAYLAAKHFASDNKIQTTVAVIVAVAMVTALDVDITRESIYWLTGSFNYVYPFAVLMLYWYLLYSGRGKYAPALYVLGFFSAATTEQNGMMTVGVTVLYLIDEKFIRKEQLSAKIACLLIPTLIGFCSVYFAPATFVRYGIETEKGMLEVMKEQLPKLYYEFMTKRYMLPFIMLNFIAMGLFIAKNSVGSLTRKLAAASNIVSVSLVNLLSATSYVHLTVKLVAAAVILAVLFALSIVCIFAVMLKDKPRGYLTACTAFILSFGSQFMMSASPVSGSRTMLCGIFTLVIFDIALLSMICTDKKYGAAALLVSVVFIGVGANKWADTYVGYSRNYPYTSINEKLIEEYKENADGTLEQMMLPYPDHCWSMPYQSSYHLYYYKMYYGLPEDTQIIWRQ